MAKRRRRGEQRIPNTQHTFTAGRTGSGKSVCLQAFTAGYDRAACLDVKLEFTWGDFVHPDDVRIITRLDELPTVEEPKIIYRPQLSEMTLEHYSEFYFWCYYEENIVCLSDELMGICPNPHVIPEGLKAILTRGRSKRVPHWGATQRPSGIPQLCMSEASHFFIYDLNLLDDRKKLVHITGCPELIEKPNMGEDSEFHYWYYNVQDEEPTKCKLILPE
ncbi:hypothetical protein E8L90_29710 [Brevibacillus antibioticus]|uniref:ATP-binding protein n=1 Tax=Brevibacillus antibioticus TaxID=2570228 RepID=A0A4U2XZ97_9BACL|nr:hypothetical protein [Brevibacillus antibioticus]TKI52934.1 hypothetical protein E8L90_29710 [Brevibacillus antibioticus]